MLPFPPYSNKVECGHIQYIVRLSLKLLDVLSMTIGISSSSSMLKDVTSSTSSSFKIIKSTPFFKTSSLCDALHFQPFFFLDARRLKLSTNYFVNFFITFECLHFDKIVLLSSLSLVCLITSLFLRFSSKVNNSSMLVSSNIFVDFVFFRYFFC